MSLEEFFRKATNQYNLDIQDNLGIEEGHAASYRQFEVVGEDADFTVKDSIHLDWSPLKKGCPEAGVTVKIWDGFAHRLLWNKTWRYATAFQPLSTRYETDRSDSPIEGFVFRLWQWDRAEVGDTFTVNRKLETPTGFTPTPPTTPSASTASTEEEEEEEESIFDLAKKSNDFYEAEDNERPQYQPPYSMLSKMIPFGQPNIDGRRHLLSLDDNFDKYKQQMNGYQKISDKKGRFNGKNRHKYSDDNSVTRLLDVTETLFYATLNHTSPQVIPLFSHKLIQRCEQPSPKEPYHCTPHYKTMSSSSKLNPYFLALFTTNWFFLAVVILESTSPQGKSKDLRDVIFATYTLVPASGINPGSPSRRMTLRTSLHKLKLSKDITKMVPWH